MIDLLVAVVCTVVLSHGIWLRYRRRLDPVRLAKLRFAHAAFRRISVGLKIGSLLLAVGGLTLVALTILDFSPSLPTARYARAYSTLALAAGFSFYGSYFVKLASNAEVNPLVRAGEEAESGGRRRK